MGSLFRIKVIYIDLIALITEASIPSLAFTIDGRAMQSVELPKKALIVIGSDMALVMRFKKNVQTN